MWEPFFGSPFSSARWTAFRHLCSLHAIVNPAYPNPRMAWFDASVTITVESYFLQPGTSYSDVVVKGSSAKLGACHYHFAVLVVAATMLVHVCAFAFSEHPIQAFVPTAPVSQIPEFESYWLIDRLNQSALPSTMQRSLVVVSLRIVPVTFSWGLIVPQQVRT